MVSHSYFYPLTNVVKNYPWGSRSALNQHFHILNPDDQPQAELWMGVHPAGISQVSDQGVPKALSDLIQRDKSAMLGEATVNRFGDLPYLLKILAAESALSIQVHPKKDQAQAGFALQQQSENTDAPDYNDGNHKPELVYAITPFMAMNGFRDIAEIMNNFSLLAVAGLSDILDTLRKNSNAEGLKAFFIALMQLPQAIKEEALAKLVTESRYLYGEMLSGFIARLNHTYPGDTGVLAPLMLNCITLKPGEAMFLHPGTLHAYVEGTAIEVMASSDNVLRAGLTGKNINLAELVKCTSFTPTSYDSLLMQPLEEHEQATYPIPVEDFRFSIFNKANSGLVNITSAEILLVINGDALLRHESGETLSLQTGQSVFIPASTAAYSLTTSGSLCRVCC